MRTNRLTVRRALRAAALLGVAASLASWLVSCGGSGGDDGGDNNVGWVTIEEAPLAAEVGSVALHGGCFVSPGASCPAPVGILGPGYRVLVRNETTGEPGFAQPTLNCLLLVFAYWNGTVRIGLGENRISVTAQDGLGNVGRATVTILGTQDVTPPSLGISSPTAGETYEARASPVRVTGWARDNAGVAEVVWTNTATDEEAPAEGTYDWGFDAELIEGENRLVVTARDQAGLTASVELTLVLVPAPTVTVSRAALTTIRTGSEEVWLTVDGTAVSPYPVNEVFWRNEFTDEEALAVGTSNWRASVHLRQGTNPLVFLARDDHGGEGAASITVVLAPL